MSEEKQEQEASQSKVTDDALDRAADELVDLGPYELGDGEEEKEEEGEKNEHKLEEGEEKEEPEDNAERSRLGRKVAHLETIILGLTEKLEKFGETPIGAPTKEEGKRDEGEEKLPTSKEELRKMLHDLQEEEAKEKRSYESTYLAKIYELGKDNDDQDAIVELMLKNHNKVLHNKPELDAELNYRAAEAEYYRTKRVEKKSPLKGDKPPKTEKPESKAVGETALDIDLDEYAKEFIAKTGMSTESVKRALSKK